MKTGTGSRKRSSDDLGPTEWTSWWRSTGEVALPFSVLEELTVWPLWTASFLHKNCKRKYRDNICSEKTTSTGGREPISEPHVTGNFVAVRTAVLISTINQWFSRNQVTSSNHVRITICVVPFVVSRYPVSRNACVFFHRLSFTACLLWVCRRRSLISQTEEYLYRRHRQWSTHLKAFATLLSPLKPKLLDRVGRGRSGATVAYRTQ